MHGKYPFFHGEIGAQRCHFMCLYLQVGWRAVEWSRILLKTVLSRGVLTPRLPPGKVVNNGYIRGNGGLKVPNLGALKWMG